MLRALLDPTRWPIPGGCQICLAWGSERLCSACVAQFAPSRLRCPRCALQLTGPHCGSCLREPLPLAGAVAAVDYAAPWDGLLHGLKYHGQLSAAPALGLLLARAVQAQTTPAPPALQLVPVPLHPQRLCERGYNQSLLLAEVLGAELGHPVQSKWVQRAIDTSTQTQLTRAQRQRQLAHAFVLTPGAPVQGQHIALVDDVMTTGATMRALALLLTRHGAASVHAWAVARTALPA